MVGGNNVLFVSTLNAGSNKRRCHHHCLYHLGVGVMIYRGYDIVAPFPPGSGPVKVFKDGKNVKEFPYNTKDETIFDWIDGTRQNYDR